MTSFFNHYVDLCGEPAWMHDMTAAHGDAAKASGARIVFSCGFDSIPFDLGVFFLQQVAKDKLGAVATRVKGRVRGMKGTISGGTLASFKATMAAASKDPRMIQVLMDPFALTEDYTGPEQPSGLAPIYEEDLGSWSAPFVMATINTKNVHRSNFLLGHSYGDNFVYDVLFVGSNDSAGSVSVGVTGDKGPGYGSTSKMIAESAVCLLQNPGIGSGGIWTPAAIMGNQLIERLQANAGLTFEVE